MISSLSLRPSLDVLPKGLQRNASSRSLQCRNTHTRAGAPCLSGHGWRDNSRNTALGGVHMDRWLSLSICHASSSAASAIKSQRRNSLSPSPPPNKLKTSVLLKSKPPSGPTPRAKTSSAPTSRTAAMVAKPSGSDIVPSGGTLNPPSFTYAPDLSVPPRKPDQSFFKYIWNAGRAYYSFYKAGVSNVRRTSKLARSLRGKASRTKAKDISEALTRAEWQIVSRSRRDMLRLPAFGLIFLVFGEWTPLLVMYITPLIPEACRIPSQVTKQLTKAENRKKDRLQRAAVHSLRLMAQDRPVTGSLTPLPTNMTAAAVRSLNALELTHYELVLTSARFDSYSYVFDLLRITPPKFWLQRSVRKQFEYLRKDDLMIERDGGHHALERKEVERACVERGFDVVNKKEDELRKALATWYTGKGT